MATFRDYDISWDEPTCVHSGQVLLRAWRDADLAGAGARRRLASARC